MIQSQQKHREFIGPTPHSLAILSRPQNKRPAEHIILERRRIENLREQSIAETKYNQHCDLKSAWERSTDKRIYKNCIEKGITRLLHNEQVKLGARRERLKDMLLKEENQYIIETEAKAETIQDRQLEMKQRSVYLKKKHEAERQAVVNEKMQMKFRNECYELRTELSKQICVDIFRDRQEQLAIKEDQKRMQAEHKELYAKMWQEDIGKKILREQIENNQQVERNKALLQALNAQHQEKDERNEKERQLRKLEAQKVKEETALQVQEKLEFQKQKIEKQKATRCARDISMMLKNRKDARERQEELATDMAILNKVLEDTQNKAVEDQNKKARDREEMLRFMHYVEKTRREELKFEQQLEQHINDEVEQKWRVKDEKKRREKEVRKILLDDVLKTRQIQIKERDQIIRKEQEEASREREEIMQQMQEYRMLEKQRIERVRRENRKYQSDLEKQMQYERKIKFKEVDDAKRELEDLQKSEIAYQERLRSAFNKLSEKKDRTLQLNVKSRAKSC